MSWLEKIDRIGTMQTLWGIVPTWLKVAIVGVVSAGMGWLQEVPLQASFLMLLGTVAFATIFFLMVTDAIDVAVERAGRRRQQLKDSVAKFAVAFTRLDGQLRNGTDVESAAVDLFNSASRFLSENFGYTYAAKLKMADQPSKLPSVLSASQPTDLQLRILARREYLERLIDEIDTVRLRRRP